MDGSVSSLLGPEGPLATQLPGYEYRPAQLEMAGRVAAVLARGGVGLVEAGTGTGKTLAYLVPALLAGRTVISTHTRNLQEQLFGKDLPLVARALGRTPEVALLKGRHNYLCRRRFARFLAEPLFPAMDEAARFPVISRWAAETATGDRAEIPALPERYRTWHELASDPESCLGGRCPHREDCFVVLARRRAAAAELVVVNHHLLLSDLALKAAGAGEVLPREAALILDEAHHLEEVATRHFGEELSVYGLSVFAREVRRALPGQGQPAAGLERAAAALPRRGQELAEHFRELGAARARLTPGHWKGAAAALRDGVRLLLTHLADGLTNRASGDPGGEFELLARRATRLRQTLDRVARPTEDEGAVAWVETRERAVVFCLAPVEVGPLLAEHLFTPAPAVVLTSATLSTAGQFGFLRERLGLTADATEEAVLPSPFDFGSQAIAYLPRSGPEPGQSGYAEHVAEQAAALVTVTAGRAFLLFTSHRMLSRVYELLNAARLPYPLLRQGAAPRSQLLAEFRARDGAVLCATHAFWEGVDVRGDDLSCVVVDKLPFAVPDEPLVAARCARLAAQGRNAFAEYSVPAAILQLKQGLGRLIRSRQDRGVLAVLDPRIARRRYGRRFLDSLPACPRTGDLDEVARWWRRTVEPPVATTAAPDL